MRKNVRMPARRKEGPFCTIDEAMPELQLTIAEADRLEGYKIVQLVGTGGYASVYKAVQLEAHVVRAVKIYDKLKLPKKSKILSIRNECKIL